MSGPYFCETGDNIEAAYIIGMIDTGAQLFLCPGHAAHFGLTLALQLLEPAEIINAAQAIGATPPANGATGETPAVRPARKRSTKAKPKPGTESKQGLPEAPAAGDDG